MVREQEPARVPFAPANSPAPTKPQQQKHISDAQASENRSQHVIPPSPSKFGQPTPLNAPYPPRSSQPNKPPARQNAPADKHLFVPSKPPAKPSRPLNHLAQLQEHFDTQTQTQTQASSQASIRQPTYPILSAPGNVVATRPLPARNDDYYNLSRSAFTTSKPPPGPQIFSSNTTSSAYFQPVASAFNPSVDAMAQMIGMSTNRGLWTESHDHSDPSQWMDNRKAEESMKALLEGTMEDEDDKPKTRTRRRKIEKAVDDLAKKIKSMEVKNPGDTEVIKDEPIDNSQMDEEEEVDDGTREFFKKKTMLLPHQIDGVNFMLDKELGLKKTRGVYPKGGILADDMGLGKTVQSIALILSNPMPVLSEDDDEATRKANEKRIAKMSHEQDKGTLVVAPLALIQQWANEIENHVAEKYRLNVKVHHGASRTRLGKELRKYDVVITTYHILISEHAASEGQTKIGCFDVHWYRIILDEAHSIKNRNAKVTKAACALNSEYRWCLSGTPMQNNLDELQSLIHFLRIAPYADLNIWREQITKPMNSGRGGLAIKRLQVYLKAFMKRRTKDVLKQDGALSAGAKKSDGPKFTIKKRTVEKIEAEFTPEEREVYTRLETRTDKSLKQMMASKVSYASALTLLLRLRQVCNHPDLIKGKVTQEKEIFSKVPGVVSPTKKSAADDIDAIADMLGGLTVDATKCDLCLTTELSAQQKNHGETRCEECQAISGGLQTGRVKKKKEKRSETSKSKKAETQSSRQRALRTVQDSDGEEEPEAASTPVRPSKVINFISSAEDENGTNGESNDDDEADETESSFESDGYTASNYVISTKIRHLIRILNKDAHEHKYIVFSFFTSMLDLIEPFLHKNSLSFVRYDGQMRADAREASLAALKESKPTSPRILLCSLRAGSLGLNLTAASRVVILEPFWNPFVEEQAIDRVHRLNQEKDVVVYKLTIKNTVEARILELQEKKRELADATIEGKMGAQKLTLQDMLNLFKHDAEHSHKVDGIGMGMKGGLLDKGEWTDAGASQSHYGYGAGRDERSRREGSAGSERKVKRPEDPTYGRRW